MPGKPPVPPPRLAGKRVSVGLVGESDAAGLLAFHKRNADHLRPWMPPAPAGFLTIGHWTRWCAASGALYAEDRAVRLVIRAAGAAEGAVLGQINLSTVVRGAFQAAHLGYHLDREAEGKGLMAEALGLVIPWSFNDFRLHRLIAAHVVGNARSARLLARLGFSVEGVAKAYLFIDDRWQDHVLTSLVDPAGRPPPRV